MSRLIIRLVINAVALTAAAYFIDGIAIEDSLLGLLLVAAVFGVVNAFIKPIVKLLTCPINVLTLGLFTLVINALMLMLTGWLSGGRISVDGFWAAFWGAIIISIVSLLLSIFVPDED